MGQVTSISWTNHTFNPWRGCTKVSPGCANCYAEANAARNPAIFGEWGDQGTRVVASEAMWREPLKWDREARAAGERRRVFCASLADVFEDRPELTMPRIRLLALAALTPCLDWLFLTKRPGVMATWIGSLCHPTAAPSYRQEVYRAASKLFDSGAFRQTSKQHGQLVHKALGDLPHPDGWPRPNWWLGVSVEDQARALERIPQLLRIPARVRFLSVEPLLGPIDLSAVKVGCAHRPLYCACSAPCDCPKVGWVIVGGESGPHARPCDVAWVRSLVAQCQAAGVPCFVKQLGAYPVESNSLTTFHHEETTPGGSRASLTIGELAASRERWLSDAKGGNPAEWPEELRVREFPSPEAP